MIRKSFTSSLYLDRWLIILRAITGIIIVKYGLEVFSRSTWRGIRHG
ncbi:hypothetical protein GO495_30925 [Chitinophaga oryziterrae]|uniref:Uncharacterized protein n=1 Tax=Chitinophaga oryziterrae TaxID=1031224 RepID=A0A6N8JLJ1_9BACT|nr:hypothetical protein [Chitinophaga oryziterrae]MVT45042.1 hypothetical protein [Chitinophaga oryziterrae]